MLTVNKSMIRNGIYIGPEIRSDEMVILSRDVDRVTFQNYLDIRGLSCDGPAQIMLDKGGRIRHLKCAGTIASTGTLFAGSIDVGGNIYIDGSLVTWLGDIRAADGDICVTEDIRSSGQLLAPLGYIAVSGAVERAGKRQALEVWSGTSGREITPLALQAALRAEAHLQAHRQIA